MEEDAKGLRVRNFFELEAKSLLERYRIIETLLPNSRTRGAAHRGEEGRHIESLLRAFLNKHLPGNLQAVSGFILCPSTKTGVSDVRRVNEHPDRHSSQLDIVVYDFDSYPVYERFEEFCILPPEGVVGIISVKKTLYAGAINAELASLKSAAEICKDGDRRGPFTALFAFASEEKSDHALNQKVFTAIKSVCSNSSFGLMVNEVSVMARTCVFKVRKNDSPPGKARYVGVDCRSQTHIPLQRLLQSLMSVYYDKSRGGSKERPGFVSFEKATFKTSPDLGLVDYSDISA